MSLTRIAMPNFGQTTAEGKILDWLKKEGDPVQRGEALAEVETDKTTVQVEAYVSGYLRRILQPAGRAVTAGEAIAILTSLPDEPLEEGRQAWQPERADPESWVDTGSVLAPAQQPAPLAGGIAGRAEPARRVLATPAAHRLAAAHGIDLAHVAGSGPGGRILEGNVRAQVGRVLSGDTPPAPDGAADGDYVDLSAVQRATGARMVRSVCEAPQFTLSVDVDLTEVERLRAWAGAATGRKWSYTAILVKAVAATLRLHPQLNVAYAEGRIRRHRDVHIGLAVATPQGLLAPVICHADQKSLDEVGVAIAALRQKAQEGKLPLPAGCAATFTVSNLGSYGIDRFTAILNPPEAGILAVGRVARRPMAVGTAVECRPVVTLTLTADHRVVDGAAAAVFLAALRDLLQAPAALAPG